MLLNIKLCAGADTVTQALREWPINCDGKDKSEDGTGYLRNTQGEVMTAEIVWRNPLPPTNDGASIERAPQTMVARYTQCPGLMLGRISN